MDSMRPPAVGDASAIRALRSVIFTGIEGAALVYPKGFLQKRLAPAMGWLGPLLTVHATDPLPNSILYIAVTPEDFRIFGRAMFSLPFEIGRWKKRSYRASIVDSGLRLKLDLELEKLGRIRVMSGLRAFSGPARQVFELVVQSAAGPVVPA
jgi:hypothetical protein